MNILDSLNINSDKLINNDALLALRGGVLDNPCGSGLAYNCTITPCDGCIEMEGIACGGSNAMTIIDFFDEYYPENTGWECTAIYD